MQPPRISDPELAELLALPDPDFQARAADIAAAIGRRDPRRAWLRRATGYPYHRLGFSYLLAGDVVLPLLGRFEPQSLPDATVLHRGEAVRLDRAVPVAEPELPRFPLLAYGANASLEGLQRKLHGLDGQDALLPVLVGQLQDMDVVYSMHLTAYGSVPATLAHEPGVAAEAALIWVTQNQFDRIAATEINYRFGRLDRVEFRAPEHSHRGHVFAFTSRHGALSPSGEPAALEPVPAAGRALPELSQLQALAAVADLLGLGTAEELVFATIERYAWAVGHFPRLGRHAAESELPGWSAI